MQHCNKHVIVWMTVIYYQFACNIHRKYVCAWDNLTRIVVFQHLKFVFRMYLLSHDFAAYVVITIFVISLYNLMTDIFNKVPIIASTGARFIFMTLIFDLYQWQEIAAAMLELASQKLSQNLHYAGRYGDAQPWYQIAMPNKTSFQFIDRKFGLLDRKYLLNVAGVN